MATDTVPAAVPGPPDPPPNTAATPADPQTATKGFLASMVTPVEPARATFDLTPTTSSDTHQDAGDGVLDRSAPGKSSASFHDTEQAATNDPTGQKRKAQGSIWKAWLLAGAQRWAKGGGTANKRLDVKKAQAQANQVKEARTTTVSKSGGLLPVRNSGGSGAGPKGNSGKSGGNSGAKGPVNSSGNRSGGAGRGGSGGGGRGPGGGSGSNSAGGSGGRHRDAAGHGKGTGTKGPTSGAGGSSKGSSGANRGSGSGTSGKSTNAGGKSSTGHDPKTPKAQKDSGGKGPGKAPGSSGGSGNGSGTGSGSGGSGKPGAAGKGGATGKDGKPGGAGTSTGPGPGGGAGTDGGKAPKKLGKTDTGKPTKTPGKDDTARKTKHPKGQTDPRTPLEKSRETGHKDGSAIRGVVDHVKAYKDGAVDGYRDKRDENAKEHDRLDKAHDKAKPKTGTTNDTKTQPGRPQPVIVTEQEDDGVTTDVKPLTVKSIDANTLTLGTDATRTTYGRRELRNFKQYERKLEAKETNLQKIADACKQLEKEAEKEAKDCQDLLEQAKSVEGGEKLLGKLTKLAEAAKNQTAEAAELAKRAKRSAEMCKVVLTNIQTRYAPLYKAVVDSDETKPAELRFYNDKGSYAPAA